MDWRQVNQKLKACILTAKWLKIEPERVQSEQ